MIERTFCSFCNSGFTIATGDNGEKQIIQSERAKICSDCIAVCVGIIEKAKSNNGFEAVSVVGE